MQSFFQMTLQPHWRHCFPLLLAGHLGLAAAGECETNFNVRKSPDGSTLTASVVATPFASPEDVGPPLQQAAERAGHKLSLDKRSATEVSYLISPQDVNRSKWLLMKLTANARQLILVSLSPADFKMDAEEMRAIACDLLAQVVPKPSAEPSVAEPSRGAAPPLTSASGRVLRPKALFDVDAASEALKPGTATITGIACSRRRNGQETVLALAKNQEILLFPATPYLLQAMDLIHDAKPGDQLDISKIAFATRIVGQTNAEGRFQFSQIKPGKYYILAQLAFRGAFTGNRQIGSVHASDGSSATVNQIYSYTNEYNDMLEKTVEIGRPGETIDVTVSPRYKFSLNPAKSGGHAGLLGCR